MVIESKALEKHFGKKIMTERLNIEGFSKPIPFDIYDGYAVCENYKGHRYDLSYPTLKGVQNNKEIAESVMKYVGLDSVDDITIIHVILTFPTLYKDGVEVEPKN